MKKQLTEIELKEMFDIADKQIVTGQAGMLKICRKKATDLGLSKMDPIKIVTALVEDYENSSIFTQKKGSYHGSAFALYLNIEISKL